MPKRFKSPSRGLICVAGSAGIRYLILVRDPGRHYAKRVRAYSYVPERGLDLRYVTRYALASRRAFLVVSVFLKRPRARTIGRERPMAIQAELARRFAKLRVIASAVNVVARKTCDPPAVHQALDKIVALHSVLVCGAVRKMCKRRLAERVLLQLPIIAKMQAHTIAYRPIIVFALDGTRERPALRMTLDARVVGFDVVHPRWIDDIAPQRPRYVFTSRSVAALAAHVPFHDLLRLNVVVHRVAAIARRPRGPLHVVGRIKRFPPIRPFGDKIGFPGPMGDVPLRRLRIIVIPNSREVALLPNTSVYQCDLLPGKLGDWIRCKVWKNRFRMLARIAHHVRHGRFLPAVINLLMAFRAGLRTGVARRSHSVLLLRLLGGGQLAKAANEQHQFPPVIVGFIVRTAPRGHACQAHTVLDDVVDFAVREVLRSRRAQIRRFGIEIPAFLSYARAVRAVANRATREKMIACFLQVLRSGFPRIGLPARAGRNRQVSHRARHQLLNGRRFFLSTETVADQHHPIGGAKNNERQARQQEDS